LGGQSPEVSEILCNYLARPNRDPKPPTSRGEARVVVEALLSAWDELDRIPDLESRWIREDIAKSWSLVITQLPVAGTWEFSDTKLLEEVRDRINKEGNKVGRGYLPGIKKELEPFEIRPSPTVRTLVALVLLNLAAVLLYRLSPGHGGLERWLPFVVPLAAGVGVSLADLAAWANRLHTIPWLLGGLLLLEFAALVGAGVLSPKVLRHIAPVKPFNFVVSPRAAPTMGSPPALC
jgi:hypothetical protein